VLEGLTRRSQTDAYAVMKIAATGSQDGIDFEGNYTVEEITEYVATMKKLFVVRDVVLKVNTEYIRSAGQSSAYRTEPPFLLQGSYRNMNRIGARVLPMMNDEELWTLIISAYEQDAQTLTSGAEANLLKFRELVGHLTEEHTQRWSDIKKTFQRNLLLGGEGSDSMTRLMGQLTSVGQGLDHIKDAITQGVTSMGSPPKPTEDSGDLKQTAQDILGTMTQLIQEVKQNQTLQTDLAKTRQTLKQTQDTHNLVAVLEEQFHAMETWLMPMTHGERKDKNQVIGELTERFEGMIKGYTKLIEVLQSKTESKVRRPESRVKKAEGTGPKGSGRLKAERKRKPPK
jgi:hypothetical protein